MVAQLLYFEKYQPDDLIDLAGHTKNPLVFIHGMGSSGRDWQFQVGYFSSVRQVITIDLRGHGNSRCLDGEYSLESFKQDLIFTLEHLGLTSCDLVGLSLGGVVCAELSLERPDLVASLSLVNAPTELKMSSFSDFFMGMHRVGMAAFCSRSYLATYMGKRLFPKPDQEELRAALYDGFTSLDRKAYMKTMLALKGLSLRDRLHRLTVPTMIVSGDRDYWPLEDKQADAQRIPGSRLEVIEDSGHATPADQPLAFNQVLEAFLNSDHQKRGQHQRFEKDGFETSQTKAQQADFDPLANAEPIAA